MSTTIVVTPRERFSLFVASLRSLFSTIPESVPVIVFNSGAPEPVRSELRALQHQRRFHLEETDEFLLPPQVRNRARPMIETEYTCFCDNDLFYQPGWLEALERNARQHGSAAVAPLTLIGPSRSPTIHHAGSEISVHLDRQGRPRLSSVHRLDGTPHQSAIDNELREISVECHEFEYHCAFIRTDMLHAIQGHDERQTKHDHLNDALRIMANGGTITFEREAVVTYHAFQPFQNYDWPFFFYRWSYQASMDSDRAIGECWGVRKNYEERELDFVKMHHRRSAATTLPRWARSVRSRSLRNRLIEWRLSRLQRRFAHTQPAWTPYVPPPPPSDALERIGIPGAALVRASHEQRSASSS